MYTPKLLARYSIISDQVDASELGIIMTELERLLIRGERRAIVELGCYIGTTSLFIERLRQYYDHAGEFHVYDSFAGLPAKTTLDSSPAGLQFCEGELAVRKKDFIRQFKKAGLNLPVIHKAWFDDLTEHNIPPGIMFAFLDGDYYRSIAQSLRLITPHLTPGAVIIVDDYANEALPGVQRAVDEWLSLHPAAVTVAHSLAIIKLI